MSDLKQHFRKRYVQPLIQFLKQGMSPNKLAWTVTLGALAGTCPLIGTTTLTCTILSFSFKLNLPAIQLVNYAVYPIQLALFLPFLKIGEYLFGLDHLSLDPTQLWSDIDANFWGLFELIWRSLAAGTVVWLLFSIIVGAILQPLLLQFFKAAHLKMSNETAYASKTKN